MSADLAAFLLARIAEDEDAARAAEPGPWVVGTTTEPVWAPGRGEHWGETVFTRGGVYPQTATVRGTHVASKSDRPRMVADMARGYPHSLHEPTSDHIARWDPARVLAECEARRRIVAEHPVEDRLAEVDPDLGEKIPDCTTDWQPYPCRTLRLLALPYSSHPDFDPEWRLT